MDILRQLKQAIDAVGISAETMLLAVSGGADSVALLHATTTLFPTVQLRVAHVNHQLRGVAADNDAGFVELLAKRLGAQVHLRSVDVLSHAIAGESAETAARRVRYQQLASVANEAGCTHIVTGHHQDDQLETILMNLVRGTGLAGLRGMQSVADVPFANGHALRLFRPLLAVSRETIEAYCNDNNLDFATDDTNADEAYLRNRVRHQIVPQLRAINPAVSDRVKEMATVLAAEHDYLDQFAQRAFERISTIADSYVSIGLAQWRVEDVAMQRRILRKAAAAVGIDLRALSATVLEQMCAVAISAETGSSADATGGWRLTVTSTSLYLHHPTKTVDTRYPQLTSPDQLSLSVPGKLNLANGWSIEANLVDPLHRSGENGWAACVSLGMQDNLFVRGRQVGERMRPLNLDGSKKVKDVMVDRKIEREFRPKWPIIATQDQAVWIAGHTLDDRFKVTAASERIVEIVLMREDRSV